MIRQCLTHYKNNLFRLLIIFFMLLISSCSSINRSILGNSEFACEAPEGQSCKRVSDILMEDQEDKSGVNSTNDQSLNILYYSSALGEVADTASPFVEVPGVKLNAYRTKQKDMTIIIYPWLDRNGYYHEGDVVITTVKPKFIINNSAGRVTIQPRRILPPVSQDK